MEALFLVVTMTGTAEMIAEDIIDAHGDGHDFALRLAERVEPSLLQQTRNLVVVSSTYGSGDIPDPGKAFFDALKCHPADLSHINYAVISLGDRIYADTFANGGLQWDALLKQSGAVQLLEPLLLDASASDSMSDRAIEWAGRWLELANAATDLASPHHE